VQFGTCGPMSVRCLDSFKKLDSLYSYKNTEHPLSFSFISSLSSIQVRVNKSNYGAGLVEKLRGSHFLN
jgi:hypothetical protein